jgi:hypothetical protein
MKKILFVLLSLTSILALLSCSGGGEVVQYCDWHDPQDVVLKSDYIFIGEISGRGKKENSYTMTFPLKDPIYILQFRDENKTNLRINPLADSLYVGMLEDYYKTFKGKYFLFIGTRYGSTEVDYLKIWIYTELSEFDPNKSLDNQSDSTYQIYKQYYEIINTI